MLSYCLNEEKKGKEKEKIDHVFLLDKRVLDLFSSLDEKYTKRIILSMQNMLAITSSFEK